MSCKLFRSNNMRLFNTNSVNYSKRSFSSFQS
eukprot:UN06944